MRPEGIDEIRENIYEEKRMIGAANHAFTSEFMRGMEGMNRRQHNSSTKKKNEKKPYLT